MEWKKVIDFFINEKKPIVEVSFTDNATREFKFGSTHDHPFWVESRGWVEVQNLVLGDRVVDHEGENFEVSKIFETGRFETTFNFTVADFHTYFVGQEGVWVHNMGRDCGKGRRGGNAKDKKQIDDVAKLKGIDRHEFSDFIHEAKEAVGKRGDDNFTFKQLKKLADQFKNGGKL